MAAHVQHRVSAPFPRPSGKRKVYYYYVYDACGKRLKRSTGMHTRAAAMQVIQERMFSGTLITDRLCWDRKGSPETLADACRDFYIEGRCPIAREKEFRGKPYTDRVLKENRQRLDLHILPYLGEKRLCDITVATIKGWLHTLQDKGLSNSTINRVRNTAIPVFDSLAEQELIPSNPVRSVKPMSVSSISSRDAFTDKEIKAIFSVEWGSPLARLACLLAACTGMRIGEVRALRPMDIVDGAVLIRHSATEDGKLKSTKSGKSRICALPEGLEKALKAYCRGRNDLIFTTNGTAPVSGTYINGYLRDAMAKAGIDDSGLSFHSFRHYFNSRLVGAGVSGELVRAVIGHQSEAMTDRYLHLRSDQLEAVRKVQESIGCLYNQNGKEEKSC